MYKAFNMLSYEKQLLNNDPSYYRVLNLTVNTFNDARTSYYLKSIGGYSAAKLRRYQDLIDEHISKMNWKVINMLNTKYIVSKGPDGQPYPYPNPDAMGNCWFVDSLLWVNNANDESDALRQLDLNKWAVSDSSLLNNKELTAESFSAPTDEDQIVLKSYQPNQLKYHSKTLGQRLAVLSEIYYPYGWKAWIDGQPTGIYRVNYMLRAVVIPEGEHQLILRFEPESIQKGNILSLCCLAVMIITLLSVAGWKLYSYRKHAA